LKLFGARPRYVWKRTTDDVVSLPQMQSSGERDDNALTKAAQSRDEVFALI
jgi:hypothetical protein